MPKFRSRFSEQKKVNHKSTPERLTVQADAKEADINNKVAKHMRGAGKFGMPIGNPAASRQLTFGHSPSESYHEMLNRVTDIKSKFMTLPSRLRGRFGNDPYQLLRWTENPANQEEAVRLGLVENPELRDLLEDRDAAAQKKADTEAKEASKASKADEDAQPRFKGRKAPGEAENE